MQQFQAFFFVGLFLWRDSNGVSLVVVGEGVRVWWFWRFQLGSLCGVAWACYDVLDVLGDGACFAVGVLTDSNFVEVGEEKRTTFLGFLPGTFLCGSKRQKCLEKVIHEGGENKQLFTQTTFRIFFRAKSRLKQHETIFARNA